MKSIFAALLATASFAAADVSARDMPAPSGAKEAPAQTIGDIMAMQQMRHIKLWFAGRGGNWLLADYEIDKLKDGFEKVQEQLGGDTVEKTIGPGLSALETAVDGKDGAAFAAAYDLLSAGCNSCHSMLDHAFIVIQRPASLPYGDQLFAAPK